jgi:hypothetical protein
MPQIPISSAVSIAVKSDFLRMRRKASLDFGMAASVICKLYSHRFSTDTSLEHYQP